MIFANMTQNIEETITITKKEYQKLLDDQLFLEALRQGGVDDWEWYDEAGELYEQWKKEDVQIN